MEPRWEDVIEVGDKLREVIDILVEQLNHHRYVSSKSKELETFNMSLIAPQKLISL